MIPITISRQNILHWLYFGFMECWRVLKAFFMRSGSRELEVTRYVEAHAIKGNPESVLAAMDTFARKRRFLMNVGEEKGAILDNTLRSSQAKHVLELGAYCGYSAVLIGKHLKAVGGTLVSLEASPQNADLARRVVAHAGLSSVVTIKVGYASECIPELKDPFDFVFIDHWKDDYLSDFRMLEKLRLLKPGAHIVADNVGIFRSTLTDYLRYVRSAAHIESFHFITNMEYSDTISDGVEVSIWKFAGA